MKKYSTILWLPLLFALVLGACRDSTIYPDHGGNNGGNNSTDSSAVSIDALLGAEWRLVGFQRQNGSAVQLDKVPDDQTFTLTFGTGDAAGMADCKGYAYQYSHTDEGKISFFNPAPQIALVCPSGSYDAKFYNALETSVAYKATKATLYIYYGDDEGDRDRALYFVRKDQQGGDSEPIVLYRLEEIRLKSSDPYKVLNASITGDRIDLRVQYAGGCEQHDFTLMGPLTIATGGLDLNHGTGTPVNAYLYHNANGDACEALITEDIRFDLTPLKERWKEVTGRTDGLIRLTINDLHSGDIWTLYYQIGNGGGVPNWLQDTIAAIKSRPAANPPESIWQYTYQGEIVYYRPPICCDIFSVLYDEEGNVICSPDGGIAGHGDGRCPDFGTTAGNRKLVWQDPR